MATKSIKKAEKKHLTIKTDIIVIAVLLAVGLAIAAMFFLNGKSGRYVQVSVDGTVVKTLSLSENTEYEISNGNGGTNILVIENGEAFMKDASCPDKLCVKMGRIKMNGQSIICLPNKVVVEVIGDGTDTEGDVDITVG